MVSIKVDTLTETSTERKPSDGQVGSAPRLISRTDLTVFVSESTPLGTEQEEGERREAGH